MVFMFDNLHYGKCSIICIMGKQSKIFLNTALIFYAQVG
jgi:hypothetical protein